MYRKINIEISIDRKIGKDNDRNIDEGISKMITEIFEKVLVK